MTPQALFWYFMAAALGLALGFALLAFILGFVYILGAAVLRRFVRR